MIKWAWKGKHGTGRGLADMVTAEANVEIDESGEVTLHLPDDFPRGQRGQLKVVFMPDTDVTEDDEPWTDEEIEEALNFTPVPAEGIVTGGWEDLGITDSVEWSKERRRQRREKRGW